MDQSINIIRKHTGQIYITDTILTMLESLRPSKESHKKQISRMIREITVIRNYECTAADNLHSQLSAINKNSDGCDCEYVGDGFCPHLKSGAVCKFKTDYSS